MACTDPDLAASLERLRAEAPELAAEVAHVRGLGGVLSWMKGRGLPLGSVEIVAQDEFSNDFIVPLPAEQRYLVFAVT